MEFSSQSDGGGGGYHGRSSPLTGLLSATPRHDNGRPQPPRPAQQALQDGQPDPAASSSTATGQHPVPPPVLSLDQIRVNRCSNEYTDGPAVTQRSPASAQRGQQKSDPAAASPRTSNERQETPDERPNNIRNLLPTVPRGGTGTGALLSRSRDGSLRSSDTEDSQGQGSPTSGQGLLLGGGGPGQQIIRTQPKHAELSPDELKPLNDATAEVVVRPGRTAAATSVAVPGRHRANHCEDCGRCRCADCVRPRPLPSCWLCGRRCVCSADTAVDYGTCACCVKGLFYHCSSDDEDTCADKPFSCAQSHCCVRWAAVSLLALVLPCLLCYLPAKGCLAACQSCYNRAARPGCRCKGGGGGGGGAAAAARAVRRGEASDKPA